MDNVLERPVEAEARLRPKNQMTIPDAIVRALIAGARERLPLLIDQGEADEFLPQLRPELLRAACDAAGHPLTLRLHPGYDHGYYFIASFIADHVAHHARALRG